LETEEADKCRRTAGRLLRESTERPTIEATTAAARRLLAGELGRDLANIQQAVRLVGCRLEVLAGKLDGDTDSPEPEKPDTYDHWVIGCGGETVVFQRTAGHGPGSCTVVASMNHPRIQGFSLPVSPQMSKALMAFLERVHHPLVRVTPQQQACKDGATIAAALAPGPPP
jgi:hypothetical protein